MAWDAVDLRTQNGLPLSDADRETILDVVGKAILDSDEDPEVLIRAAKRVGRRLGIIQNLRAYTTRAVNVALRVAALRRDEKEQPVCQYDVERIADWARRDQIENQVLAGEALETLSAQDREIVIRRMAGEPYSEIERDMNLKPRTAETRFRAAKRTLRRYLDAKTGRQTSSRVG
ncbi:MAG: sigma factor-like helix-turn-helix DNA-binding protein [Bryobacteraceae bacterium]